MSGAIRTALASRMIWRAWRGSERERAAALAFLLPAAVALVITLEAGIFLYFIKGICPTTFDPSAYVADAAYGTQWSFDIGRLFAEAPLLKFVCYGIYVAPPPALVFVYALQTRALRPPRWQMKYNGCSGASVRDCNNCCGSS